jgi:hypothetical protein
MNNLEAVRCGDWKLHISKAGEPVKLLYNLRESPEEIDNHYNAQPDVVKQLEEKLQEFRKEFGDAITGIKGEGVRPADRVENPRPLTQYNENHPYIVALYDRDEMG